MKKRLIYLRILLKNNSSGFKHLIELLYITDLSVLHTYLYIVIIWMTVSSQYRKDWTISKRVDNTPFFAYFKVEGCFSLSEILR